MFNLTINLNYNSQYLLHYINFVGGTVHKKVSIQTLKASIMKSIFLFLFQNIL